MFTDKAQAIIDRAKDYAFSSGDSELLLKALLAAVGLDAEAGVLLSECIGLSTEQLRSTFPNSPEPVACPGKLPLAEPVRAMLGEAKELADEVPDPFHPGLIDLRHLVGALATSREATALLNAAPLARADVLVLLASWYEREAEAPRLDELTERLRGMRSELMTKVFGQDHAVHAFVEGLFNAEVVAAADTKRRSPRGLFVFAGPPGVGKTFLAELGASLLKRPFRRFDMSAYSGHQQNESLVGMGKSFHAAHPGTLTEFVEKNPNAVLLFDEIEKAHTKTIHLFLQILDAGTLEDKYHERNVNFRNTTIILTTNAGRKLYDRPNESGVHSANASFHRKTILDALENEKDPETRQAFFPAAICSRMATGYPVLFNYLRVNELESVVRAELNRVAALLERQYYKRATYDLLLPMCLVLREGARADARTLRSQAETFVKTELFKFCQLFETDRLDDVFERARSIHFSLEDDPRCFAGEVQALFEPEDHPRILLVAAADRAALYRKRITEVEWRTETTAEDALQVLADEEIDMVLLDLWLGQSAAAPSGSAQQFDHVPAAARGLDQGQELLRKVRERLPSMPVYLLSFASSDDDVEDQGSIDDELFMACVRGGGARGMVVSSFTQDQGEAWEERRDRLADSLVETCRRLHREKTAAQMGQERKVLAFDTVPRVHQKTGDITIRLRNLRLTRAIAAADAGEILQDIERPVTKFDDVIGAGAAKDELQFFIDYLKNPRRFAALGLKPPKGVLLYGPPGTGKTMLARAMAGESNVAFVPASASNFVTVWQGSGPQSIRDLFDRARRYAPAIIFIDEIDAIGKTRSGGIGGGRAEENTLNALLTEMDGFSSPSPDRPVFLLAATNFRIKSESGESDLQKRERVLDPALVRRFSRPIKIDLPERATREEYLFARLKDRKACSVTDGTIRSIAERAIGLSIANLESIIETASRRTVKSGGELTDAILEEAFETEVHGEARAKSPEMVKHVASHEAGHAIMYWLSGWWPVLVTIVSRGKHGGYMQRADDEMKKGLLRGRREMISEILRVSLGGRAAEEVCYGVGEGLAGAAQDFEGVKQYIHNMLKWGMYGMEFVTDPDSEEAKKKKADVLKTEMECTVQLLADNRKHLDAVIDALVAKNKLNAEELKQILPAAPEKEPRTTRSD